jgi:hypothetical protein
VPSYLQDVHLLIEIGSENYWQKFVWFRIYLSLNSEFKRGGFLKTSGKGRLQGWRIAGTVYFAIENGINEEWSFHRCEAALFFYYMAETLSFILM